MDLNLVNNQQMFMELYNNKLLSMLTFCHNNLKMYYKPEFSENIYVGDIAYL